jgi:hypothetical protein
MESAMTKERFVVFMLAFSAIVVLFVPACSYTWPTPPARPAGEDQATSPASTAISGTVTAVTDLVIAATTTVTTETAVSAAEPTATVAVTPTLTSTGVITPTPPSTGEPAVLTGTVAARTVTANPASRPFTATVGFDTFSAYRLDFSSEFEGTRQGQPTSGDLSGFLEVTRNPAAQHLRVEMKGDTFKTLAPLGVLEIIDVGGTFYVKSPQDGQWLGIPAFFVRTMLPGGMYSPEENIDLPATAVPQPGAELVNGVLTRRFTFGLADLGGQAANYEEVEGTIWVAVDGNYVVKYEATLTGQHSNLTAGNITLLDEGTISMRYDLSEVNGDLVVTPPAGVVSFDLTKLLQLLR